MKRRNFLKTATLTATVAASFPRFVHAAGSDIIKIGMCGCGGRCSGAAADSLRSDPSVRLVAMYDVFEERVKNRRKSMRESFPDQVAVDDDHIFWNFDGYKHVIDSCDIVLIACASKFHSFYAREAVKAGKSVFVEKPHAIDVPGVRRLEEAVNVAKEKNVSLVSGMQSRFSVQWQECMKRVHDGQIGEITTIQGTFLRGPYQLVPRNPKLTETQYQFSNWYHFAWLSGDDVTQSLIHNVDRACWAMDGKLPKWCFGLAGRSASFGEVYGDMFDHHTAVYEYENGARAYMMCRTQVGCYYNVSDFYQGTKGRLNLNRCSIEGENPWRYDGPGCNPYFEEQKALVEAVKTGKPINCGDYMVPSTMMVLLGQYACYDGNAISWDEMEKSDYLFGGQLPDEVNFDTESPALPDETGNYPLAMPGMTRLIKR